MYCPACDSKQIIKNGFNALDKQMYRCKKCGRQFVLMPDKGPISEETKGDGPGDVQVTIRELEYGGS